MTQYYLFNFENYSYVHVEGDVSNIETVTDQLNEICVIGGPKFPMYTFVNSQLIVFSVKKDNFDFEDIPQIKSIPSVCVLFDFEDADSYSMKFKLDLKSSETKKMNDLLKSVTRPFKFIHYEI